MKTKWKLLFLGAIVFILYVSFKILEPEIYRNREIDFNEQWPDAALPQEPDYDRVDSDHVIRRSYELEADGIGIAGGFLPSGSSKDTLDELVKTMSERFLPQYSRAIHESPWKIAESWVTPNQVHPENAPELERKHSQSVESGRRDMLPFASRKQYKDPSRPIWLCAILAAMHAGRITKADVGHRGTQLKMTLTLGGVQKVVFKPAWYERDYVVTGLPYDGRDRHNAEIAAFHLGRILELRRTPLAIGRRVNMEKDIIPVATQKLRDTFFERDGEKCFYGRCLYCKGPDDGVCPTKGVLEGTLVLWMPSALKLKLHKHPWARTYRKGVDPKWQQRDDYCSLVKKSSIYSTGPLLLDLVETAIFDFLIGNADRHHFETFEGFNDSQLVILDNGKSFGNPLYDEMTILAPLYQCCLVRASLWQRLLALQDKVLSRVLANVLDVDPIAPVLTPPHLEAMDRRLKIALDQIEACVAKMGLQSIVVSDGGAPL